MKKAEDIHFLKERDNAVAGASAYNRLLTLVARMSSKTISIGRNNNGGLELEVIPRQGGGGGDIEITSSDASITVTPTNSGYDLKSAVTVVAGTNITVSRSGNAFTVSAPNMVTGLSVGSVYTLQPGSQAWAEISGSGASRVIDFGIPQGAKGDPGGVADGSIVPSGPLSVAISGGTATIGLNGISSASSGLLFLSGGTFTALPMPSDDSVLAFYGGTMTWLPISTCENA